MSRTDDTPGPATVRDREESFLQRFSRRKYEARHRGADPLSIAERPNESTTGVATVEPDERLDQTDSLTDADMPDIESLDEQSDYTGFLSAKVSESLRRAALRKLFHSTGFNVVDELDDYNEDFTAFEGLGDIVTAEMRHRDEIERRRQREREAIEAERDDALTAESGDPDETEAQPAAAAPGAAPDLADTSDESDATDDYLEGRQYDKPSAPV